MAWCTPSPFPLAVLAEATRICPTRRGAPGHGISSDGICGDRAHQAEISDHNPDSRGIPHAVDISQSTPGAPYWEPGLGVFDAHAYGYEIAQRIIAGTERRVKYLVSFNGHVDIIFDPSVSLTWRQNGSPKQDHASHLHVSFLSGPAVENSTAPFFGGQPAPPAPAPLPPFHPPAPITTTFEESNVRQTDLTTRLDAHGNGAVDLPGVSDPAVHSWGVIGIRDPLAVHVYDPIPRVAFTLGGSAHVDRFVLEGGGANQVVTIRVVHD